MCTILSWSICNIAVVLHRYLIALRVLSSNSNRTELSGDLNERRGETPLHSAFGALCSTRCSADPLCCTTSVSCQVPIKWTTWLLPSISLISQQMKIASLSLLSRRHPLKAMVCGAALLGDTEASYGVRCCVVSNFMSTK